MSEDEGTTARTVRSWMDSLEAAWHHRDSAAIAALFTPNAWYRQGPFGRPLLGRSAILEHWAGTLERQCDQRIWLAEPIVTGDRAAFEWWCIVRDPATGAERTAAGCVILWFAGSGLCRGLHEYWHSQPSSARPPHDSWQPGRRGVTKPSLPR
jgi:nuclear transport factor 2 (NTF2) superfamily protein